MKRLVFGIQGCGQLTFHDLETRRQACPESGVISIFQAPNHTPNANSSILRLHRMCRWVRGKYGEIPATEDRYCDPSAGFKSLIAISLLTDVSCFTIENLLNAEMWYLNTPLLKTFDLYEKPLEKHCLKFLVCFPFSCTLQLTIMKYVCPVDIRNSLVLTEYGFLHWVRPSARLSHGSRHVGRNSGCTDVTGGPPETNLSPQSRSESWWSHQAIVRQYTVVSLDEKEASERSDYQVGAKVDRDLISSSSLLSFTTGGGLRSTNGSSLVPITRFSLQRSPLRVNKFLEGHRDSTNSSPSSSPSDSTLSLKFWRKTIYRVAHSQESPIVVSWLCHSPRNFDY